MTNEEKVQAERLEELRAQAERPLSFDIEAEARRKVAARKLKKKRLHYLDEAADDFQFPEES